MAIDIDNKPIIESSLVRGEKTKHDLSRDSLKMLIRNEPVLSSYELIGKLSFAIVEQNLNNKMALYYLYRMLGYCANQFNDINNSAIYYKIAFDHLLQRKLQTEIKEYSDYVMILTKNNASCGKCDHLSDSIYTREEILMNNPLPHKDCTREYNCSATYMTMSERQYLRHYRKEK